MEKKYITLSFDPDRPDGPWFMSTGALDKPKGHGKFDPIKVPKGKPAELIFKIQTKGIEFRKGEPIEISLIPGQDPPGDVRQFTWPTDAKGTLVVKDANQDSEHTDYYYKLNFDNGTSLDPIIQNGCCKALAPATGWNMSLVTESSALAALLLAAVAIVLAAMRLRRARA